MSENIPLYKPYMPEKLPEMEAILHSGALAYGKWGRKFEAMIAGYTGAPHVAVVNSYNAAVQIALKTLDIGAGDEVIASPQSCLASNMPILSVGAKTVWADIDPKTGTLSPDSVRKKITPATRAIFHNHHCGYPGYIDEINAIGKEKGIFVIDDCIEAFGAVYKDRMLGAAGADVSLFSFQTVRLPNAIDGGAVCFRDAELHEKACRMRDLGVDRKTFRDNLGEISPASDVTFPGMGVTMNEISSYIGCRQMEDMDALLERQRNNADRWREQLAAESGVTPLGRSETLPNYWVFGLLYGNGREKGILHFREMGYHASSVHLPNYYYSVFNDRGERLSGVREFYEHYVAVPCGWWFNQNKNI